MLDCRLVNDHHINCVSTDLCVCVCVSDCACFNSNVGMKVIPPHWVIL